MSVKPTYYASLTLLQVEELIRYAKGGYSMDLVPSSIEFPCKIAIRIIQIYVDSILHFTNLPACEEEGWVQYGGYTGIKI
jgi:hypothetical protein